MPLMHTATLPVGAKFSPKRAARAVRFIEKATVHTKSAWSGKPFLLTPWQKGSAWQDESGLWRTDGVVTPLFGAVKWSPLYKQWVRQFAMAWFEVARKNGKSELMAAIGLYLLIFDGEHSGEVYSAASDRYQAAMVFDVARDMILLSPMLRRMKDRGELQIIDSQKRIVYTPTRSIYRVIAADAAGNLGANPSAVLFDEVLAQPDERLWDYLRQGFGTRPQPLLVAVTTAGPSRESFAYAEHEFSIRVATEPDLDPSRFVYMAFVDESADWLDESHWPEANPGAGDFLNMDTLRSEALAIKNKGDLSQIANFRIFRLNQWGTSKHRWLDVAVWDESEERSGPFTDESTAGVNAVGGLDLAETTDFVSWQIAFPTDNRLMVISRFWITRSAIERKHRKMMAKLLQWEADGWLTIVEQDAHNYDAITAQILSDIETYRITTLGYDQFQAPAIINRIEDRTDVVCVKVPQTTTRMNPGAKELTRVMGLRRLTTNENPVMRWMADNAAYKQDADGNIKPSKVESSDSIDGITALVNALTVAVTVPQQGEVRFHVFEGCPMCGDSEISESYGVARCLECGHRWNTEEAE
jgi:phage terminase large subunit-like protein